MNTRKEPLSDRDRFDAMLRRLLSVPHSEIRECETEYKKNAAAAPKRRGRKKHITGSSSLSPDAS